MFNTLRATACGHDLVCVANLFPTQKQESDSFMYQTVGVEVTPLIAQCLGVPILRREIKGTSLN